MILRLAPVELDGVSLGAQWCARDGTSPVHPVHSLLNTQLDPACEWPSELDNGWHGDVRACVRVCVCGARSDRYGAWLYKLLYTQTVCHSKPNPLNKRYWFNPIPPRSSSSQCARTGPPYSHQRTAHGSGPFELVGDRSSSPSPVDPADIIPRSLSRISAVTPSFACSVSLAVPHQRRPSARSL